MHERKYAENISRRRREIGMTQEELAGKSGYNDRSVISRIEKGERGVSIEKMEDIAKALREDPSVLAGWKKKRKGKGT